MFHENLTGLRKLNGMTQEELAERVGVSRQTLAKWESGETMPDISKSMVLAEIFDVSLDELANYSGAAGLPALPPDRGRHIFGVVKVGENGQIVIPKRARKVLKIQSGDRLIALGDEKQGLAFIKEEDFWVLADVIKKMSGLSE